MGELLKEDEREGESGLNTGTNSPTPSAPSDPSQGGQQHEGGAEVQGGDGDAASPAPVAVEADGRQREEEHRQQDQKGGSGGGDLVSHKFIFGVVFSRCRDVSATVRACALQTLAKITEANNPTMATVIRNLLGQQEEEVGGNDGEATRRGGAIDFVDLLSDASVELATMDPLPSTEAFMDFLRKRALDDSVYVRKNALQACLQKV